MWLTTPMPMPTLKKIATGHSPSGPQIQNDATTRNRATKRTRFWSRSTRPSEGRWPSSAAATVVSDVSAVRVISTHLTVGRGFEPAYASRVHRSAARTRTQKPMQPAMMPSAMPTRTKAGAVPASSSTTRPMTSPPTTAAASRPPRPMRSRPRRVFRLAGSDRHRSSPDRLPSLCNAREPVAIGRARATSTLSTGPERAHCCQSAVDRVARHGAWSSGRGWFPWLDVLPFPVTVETVESGSRGLREGACEK